MKKQFSKEKYIGLPQKDHNNKGSENNSFGDLGAFLDSPTKTPRKELKNTGFTITNLKDRRDLLKKNATIGENSEENQGFIEEEEGIRRSESFYKNSGGSGHKKNISVHISRGLSGPQGIQSAKSNFGVAKQQIQQQIKGFHSNFEIY